MEDFVAELRSGKDSSNMHNHKKPNKIKELVAIIANSNPEIKIIDKCTGDGDCRFELSSESIGLDINMVVKYKAELSSDFVTNFIGELIVRDNIDKFVIILRGLRENYSSFVNKYEHKKFGMRIVGNRIIMAFHLSFLQSLMTEDFKKVV